MLELSTRAGLGIQQQYRSVYERYDSIHTTLLCKIKYIHLQGNYYYKGCRGKLLSSLHSDCSMLGTHGEDTIALLFVVVLFLLSLSFI